jgi:hypothetical protein
LVVAVVHLMVAPGPLGHMFTPHIIIVVIMAMLKRKVNNTHHPEDKVGQELLEFCGMEMSVHTLKHVQDHHKNEMFNSNR